MSAGTPFLNVFQKLPADHPLADYYPFLEVIALTYQNDGETLEISAAVTRLLPSKQVLALADLIKETYPELPSKILIRPVYDLPENYTLQYIISAYWESIVEAVAKHHFAVKRIFETGEWSVEAEDRLRVSVPESVFFKTMEKEWRERIQSLLREQFHRGVLVTIEQKKVQKNIRISEEELVRRHIELNRKPAQEKDAAAEETYVSMPRSSQLPSEHSEPKHSKTSGKGLNKGNGSRKGFVKSAAHPALLSDPDLIFGRPFNDAVQLLKDFQVDEEGPMVLHGNILSIRTIPLKNGEKTVVVFDMTDLTDSITVKIFVKNDDLDVLLEELKVGAGIRIKGNAVMDTFEKEVVLQSVVGIYKAAPVEKPNREDLAPVKRVELHCHTKMSKMDGINSAEELVKTAIRWGHKALAITDHGCVYAFPKAHEAAKGKIKILYGVEAYLVDDTRETVVHPKGQAITAPAVVFDLETTGLSPVRNRIIEIGAVKIENGRIIDRFSTFVNPKTPIPLQIELKTHISDDMVKDAPEIETVLPEFLNFIEGCYLVAHNASFDVGFIRENMKRLGITHDPFTYADTLPMARFLLQKLSRFSLDHVAKELNISLENHHRAVDDAECTAYIFLKFLDRLKNLGCETLDDVQGKLLLPPNSVKKLFSHHAILLVENETGRVNLYKLCSEASLNYYYEGHPVVPKSLVQKYHEGILVGSACSEGELYEAIMEGRSEEEIERILSFYDYLEIQPVLNNEYLVREQKYAVDSIETLQDINREIVRLGALTDKLVVATGDVHFLNPEDSLYREVIQEAAGYKDADKQPPLYFRTTEEMLQEFSYLGSDKAYEVVVTNPNKIAERIEDISAIRLNEKGAPYKAAPVIENSDKKLRSICYRTAHKIYGDPLPEEVTARLEKELTSIISNDYAVLYLIAYKLVLKSKLDGYVVGSRGSVGSSFVAYLAGITEVNPLSPHYVCPECKTSIFDGEEIRSIGKDCCCDLPDKTCPRCGAPMQKLGFNIPFETFLGFHGDKEPDIDLNYSGEYQAKAHAYTEVIFGQGQTFKAGTVTKINETTARGYFMHYYERKMQKKRRAEIGRMSQGLLEIRRSSGQHPGGIVVLPFGEDITTFTPIQHPADDSDSSVVTTAFDYHAIDKNLLKLDILGHKDPTTMKALQDLTEVDPATFPLNGPEVISLFQSTEALNVTVEDLRGVKLGILGIPEFGTEFAMNMVITCKPKNFSDLVRISGMAHGENVWTGNNQELFKNGTADLSNAICCRDDIMLYLISMGLDKSRAFEIMESVRKGKKVKPEWAEDMKAHGVPDWYIWSCNKIHYMFPKAHAVAYVMMGWRIGYCKIHYPMAFYSAYFSIRAEAFNYEKMALGHAKVKEEMSYLEKQPYLKELEKSEYGTLQLVNEMYARGFSFVKIDLNKVSATQFTIVDDHHLMPSLTSIDGMGEAAANNIVDAVQNGSVPFTSIRDFKNRAHVSQTITEKLQELKILENLPEDDQLSLFDAF